MKNTMKLTLLTLLTSLSLLNVQAEAPAHPNVNVWMSYWSRSFKEQNEFCQPNSQSCGQTNSMFPRKLFYNFDFNLSDSFINFVAIGAKTIMVTGFHYFKLSLTNFTDFINPIFSEIPFARFRTKIFFILFGFTLSAIR